MKLKIDWLGLAKAVLKAALPFFAGALGGIDDGADLVVVDADEREHRGVLLMGLADEVDGVDKAHGRAPLQEVCGTGGQWGLPQKSIRGITGL